MTTMPNNEPLSPRIEALSWGRMLVEGVGEGKDFKLWPGGGRAWDWNETGTRHNPGILPGDVKELLEHGCRIVVLSRGMLLMLRAPEETIKLLQSAGVEIHIDETKAAARLYNQLAGDGAAVGGLFHSTC